MCLLFFRFVERRSTPASALNSDKKAFQYLKQKPDMFSLSLVPSTNSKHCSVSAQQCERCPSSKTTLQKKEEEEAAECKKKFAAVPVPGNLIQPIYQEMMELREKERKQGHEQRKEFLLSIQKPFSFEERDKNRREKVMAVINRVSEDPKNSVRVQKTFHRNLKGSRQQKGGSSFSLGSIVFWYILIIRGRNSASSSFGPNVFGLLVLCCLLNSKRLTINSPLAGLGQ